MSDLSAAYEEHERLGRWLITVVIAMVGGLFLASALASVGGVVAVVGLTVVAGAILVSIAGFIRSSLRLIELIKKHKEK